MTTIALHWPQLVSMSRDSSVRDDVTVRAVAYTHHNDCHQHQRDGNEMLERARPEQEWYASRYSRTQ